MAALTKTSHSKIYFAISVPLKLVPVTSVYLFIHNGDQVYLYLYLMKYEFV
jgi:hypothetical protein